jgi:hypothetical protein
MPNFSDILDTPSTEISRPKVLPQGTYLWMVKGLPRIDKSTRKGTEFSEYTSQCLEASDDVDPDALKACLTKPSGEVTPLRERSIRVTHYHVEGYSLYRLKMFLLDLGIDEEDEDGNPRSIRDMMQDVPGRQFWGHVKHTPSDDGEMIFANIDKTAKVA